jgi:hypothetical protein
MRRIDLVVRLVPISVLPQQRTGAAFVGPGQKKARSNGVSWLTLGGQFKQFVGGQLAGQ